MLEDPHHSQQNADHQDVMTKIVTIGAVVVLVKWSACLPSIFYSDDQSSNPAEAYSFH